MRFKSQETSGFTVYAVSGINTVSFAVDFEDQAAKGLLGFAVERYDPKEEERYFMYGQKVFEYAAEAIEKNAPISTYDHPVQSFVWDDFTAKPGRRYDYWFHPLRGKPKNLDRSAPPIHIGIETEPLFTKGTHDVFFNRGAASSQAYLRKFHNKAPDKQPTKAKRQEALDWLSRNLDEALYAFIDQAAAGDTILGCFYEFRYIPALEKLKQAMDRGVTLRLILDGKDNSYTDKKGKFHEAFPLEENRRAVRDAGLAAAQIHWRTNNANDIQHNKFMVLLKGAGGKPMEVWTGSTNLSNGGVHGQTNVGHWVRDETTAQAFADYWKILVADPGSAPGDNRKDSRRKRADYRNDVMALGAPPAVWADIPKGVSTIFSPRTGSKVLEMYVNTLDSAEISGGVTLAFGINKAFKSALVDNDSNDAVLFLLLEKKDKPNPRSKTPFVPLKASHNVYKAWGSYLRNPLTRWARETDARGLGLNSHVAYVHSKFMMRDPLSADPVVISGSANFSDNSTNSNDENMLLVRGDLRVADIYFTEFNRLFNHYYFRSVVEVMQGKKDQAGNGAADTSASLFLKDNDEWLAKYKPGKLRRKRLDIYSRMEGTRTL